jgi:excisionase family DNA binding protein
MDNPFYQISIQLQEIQNKLNGFNINSPPDKLEIITQDELCKRLMISKPTVIRLVKKKKIPEIRIGSLVRYNYQSVIKALENGQNKI